MRGKKEAFFGDRIGVWIEFSIVLQSQTDLCGKYFIHNGSCKYKFECVRGEKEAFFGGKRG